MMTLEQFLDSSYTARHAARNVVKELEAAGFVRLEETSKWSLVPGGQYFVERMGRAVIAFVMPSEAKATAFRIIGSHLDSPAFYLKTEDLARKDNLNVVPTGQYGGVILTPWMDRPLSTTVFNHDGTTREFPASALIPNLAIHFCRDINDGHKYNKQEEMQAIITDELGDYLKRQDNAMPLEAYLYDAQPAVRMGDLINSPRIDNLSSAYPALVSICKATPRENICVSFFADNEEIGSRTPCGAASMFLRDTLERISLLLDKEREEFFCALGRSMFLSVDVAHATHPSYERFYDSGYAPEIGKGVAVKLNPQGAYSGNNAEINAIVQECGGMEQFQLFTNRSDMGCGTTIGPVIATNLGIRAVDIGIPILSMHSIRETAALSDIAALEKVFDNFSK